MLLVKFITSFIAGGLLISIQSIFAERYPKYGGYIISLPTTLPISLFFIGWIAGNNESMIANSAVPFAIINLIFFSFLFFKLIINFKDKVLLTNFISLFAWFLISILISKYSSDSKMLLSIIICVSAIYIAIFLFNRHIGNNKITTRSNKTVKISLLLRAIIAGTIVLISSLMSYYLSPFWGGIFAVFPASYLSNYNFIYLVKGTKTLRQIVIKVPEGSILFLIYSILFWQFSYDNILIKTILVYIITIFVGGLVLYINKKLILKNVY